MKRRLLAAALLLLAACSTGTPAITPPTSTAATPSTNHTPPASATPSSAQAATWPVTVTDSTGQAVTITAKPQRLVLLNSNAADLVRMFGQDTSVVGIADGIAKHRPYLQWPEGVTALDSGGDISAEAVATLQPDLVVSYSYNPDAAFSEQMAAAGIQLLRLNLFLPEHQDAEIAEFAKVFGTQQIAADYVAWKNKQLAPLAKYSGTDTFTGLALSGGALNSGTYRAFPVDVGEGGGLAAAGVRNLADDFRWNLGSGGTATQIDGEYIASRNPDVITLNHSSNEWGGATSAKDAGKTLYDVALADPVLSATKAGANKQILVLHTQIMGSDKRFVGQLALAKMLHPLDMAGVHPTAVLDDYFKTWLKVDGGGHWMYPEMT